MSKRRQQNPFKSLAPDERLALAQERTGRLVDLLASVFMMHEANRIISYSPALAQQIPRSRAGRAFNQFQSSMHMFEVLRLAAIWDRPGSDRCSIPSVVAMIDEEVTAMVVERTYSYHASQAEPKRLTPPSSDEEAAALRNDWRDYCGGRATSEAVAAARRLRRARRATAKTQGSSALRAVTSFRDRYVAHNLEISGVAEGGSDASPRKMQFGDENRLLRVTERIVDLLHLSLNGTSFGWEGAREQAARCSRELWTNCTFSVPPGL